MPGPYSYLTSEDYLQASQALTPRGPAWPRDRTATFTKFLDGLASFFWQYCHVPLATLFERDLDPTRTVLLLPDWEAAWGVTARGSKADRRTRLVEVIADTGGFTETHYIAVAARLGISITTEVTGPFTWTVYAPSSLNTDDRAALEAAIDLHNRATCVVSFVYDVLTDDSGTTLIDDSGRTIGTV